MGFYEDYLEELRARGGNPRLISAMEDHYRIPTKTPVKPALSSYQPKNYSQHKNDIDFPEEKHMPNPDMSSNAPTSKTSSTNPMAQAVEHRSEFGYFDDADDFFGQNQPQRGSRAFQNEARASNQEKWKQWAGGPVRQQNKTNKAMTAGAIGRENINATPYEAGLEAVMDRRIPSFDDVQAGAPGGSVSDAVAEGRAFMRQPTRTAPMAPSDEWGMVTRQQASGNWDNRVRYPMSEAPAGSVARNGVWNRLAGPIGKLPMVGALPGGLYGATSMVQDAMNPALNEEAAKMNMLRYLIGQNRMSPVQEQGYEEQYGMR